MTGRRETGPGPSCLVVAKAPVPGQAKTRLAADLGADGAADVAGAALLDTLAACEAVFDEGRRFVALAGSIAEGARRGDIEESLARWRVIGQTGDSFASRLVHAHAEVGQRRRAPVVQVGMDTPQVTGAQLSCAADLLVTHDAALGPATDGGWWLLALRESADAAALAGVLTSTPRTGRDTLAALRGRGLVVAVTDELRDVDTAGDADAVAAESRGTRFEAAWAHWRAGAVR